MLDKVGVYFRKNLFSLHTFDFIQVQSVHVPYLFSIFYRYQRLDILSSTNPGLRWGIDALNEQHDYDHD